MTSITGRKRWLGFATTLAAAMLVAGLQSLVSPSITPVFAGYELPPGERITNLPHIPRSMPQKEAFEIYDPVIGRNFDIKNFWMRADLRARPEWRTGTCFGGGAPAGGACNSRPSGATQSGRANAGQGANDFYVQQWVRLGLGYDLSPDVNFYFEIIDSANWGSNGNPNNAGNAGDPLNHSCQNNNNFGTAAGNCRLGVRAAYVLVRNMFNIQGLSMKAGRQYVIFGNHSIFGHFDWANTGYSHDGIMFQYATKAFETHAGWFRNSETDLQQAAPVGSLNANIAGCAGGTTGTPCTAGQRAGGEDGGADADMIIVYNQIKNVPGMLIEPYYVFYNNSLAAQVNSDGLGAPKHAGQVRHMFGNRIEVRKGGWDIINETAYQFGAMTSGLAGARKHDVHINAWATRNWIGYTWYNLRWKPRFAVNLDYASGDGNANCATNAGTGNATASAQAGASLKCSSANTFENFFPTNHIHMGYADVIAWKNMFAPQVNLQFRPTERDHFEFWFMNMNLANPQDNYYRAAQGPYIWSATNNKAKHIGDEYDFTWTRMFADGRVAFQATYAHIFAGEYIARNLGTGSNQSWGFVQLWMNF